jgi:hypothetical protein
MSNRLSNSIATLLLAFMFVIAVCSIKNESLTMDELAHLPAGYSYLTQQDMRINPEHPPLMKDLAGFPLLFIKGINFPYDSKAWAQDVNGQWDFGNRLLFNNNNPADEMIFWGRIPMIMILMLLGLYVFRWSRELFGNKAALIALFLFSFSPTFIAHGRLVTTDVAAAAGAFIATYYFVRFLKSSSKDNLLKAGVAFGIAELLKFSLILLVPLFFLLFIIWAAIRSFYPKELIKNLLKYFVYFIIVMLMGAVVVCLVYMFHTWNYPAARQVSDSSYILPSFPIKPLSQAVIWMADKPVLKAIAQYFLGLFMVLQRASGGNTGYFMGEISAAGWKDYFPTVYLLKETLVFHILTIIAILWALLRIKNPFRKDIFKRILNWTRVHFSELAMLLFIAIYWATSLRSNLNIGVRHLLPVFPFTMVLVGGVISLWLSGNFLKKTKMAIFGFFIIWQVVSVVSVYPHFLSYYNELAGGPANGYLYAVDSNYDWGQDLKRLKQWTDENNVDKIYIDYFGGSDTKYYFKDKYLSWWGDRNPNELPRGSYLAVSATLLQGGRGEPAKGFDSPTGYYNWLNNYEPIARAGYSIFIYKISPENLINK